MARYRVTRSGWHQCLHSVPQTRVAMRKRNGVVVARAFCPNCSQMHGPDLGPGVGLPLFEDNVSSEPCARCAGTDGAEWHHWAPRALFGPREADRWPGAYLCPACHTRWHQTIAAVLTAERPLGSPAGV